MLGVLLRARLDVSEVLTCCLCCSVSVAEKVSVAAFKVWVAGGFIGAQRFMRTLI